MIHVLDLCGVAFFAVTGSLAAGRKQMDLFGAVVLAMATALGGGSLRDMMLAKGPVFWVTDPTYILVVLAGSLVTFVAARYLTLPGRLLVVADAFGLAVFTVVGTQKAESMGAPTLICILMGVMTGAVGGMIRDVLSGEVPLVLRREIYATASLCGAIAYVAMSALVPGAAVNTVVAMVVALALRLAAIRWKLSLPIFPASRTGRREG